MGRNAYLQPYWLDAVDPPNGYGAVVVHGFTGVPWDVLPVGEGLIADGFVAGLQLGTERAIEVILVLRVIRSECEIDIRDDEHHGDCT